MEDRWGRVYLARLCAAVVYGDWTDTTKFVRGPGGPFWRMLLLIATRQACVCGLGSAGRAASETSFPWLGLCHIQSGMTGCASMEARFM